jgi:hypothetical protein
MLVARQVNHMTWNFTEFRSCFGCFVGFSGKRLCIVGVRIIGDADWRVILVMDVEVVMITGWDYG